MRFAERTARTGWERLTVSATLALDEIDSRPTIVSSTLEVRALVSGLGEAEFQSAVAEAADLCPVSRLFTGADVTVSSAALVVAFGIGASLLSARSRSGPLIASIAIAAVLVVTTVCGIAQARRLGRTRQQALVEPVDSDFSERVRREAGNAGALRAVIGALSLTLLALGVLLGS